MRCNYLVVASNTLDSEHEHRASFLHSALSLSSRPQSPSRLAPGHAGCVTVFVTINHVSLRIDLPRHEIVYRIVGHNGRTMDHLAEWRSRHSALLILVIQRALVHHRLGQ